jgi:XTP/dITP diphosphohydrolase
MPYLIFATNNIHKVKEAKSVLEKYYPVKSLREAGIFIEIPEPHDTLEKNATEKSSVVYNLTNRDCFSEDTGLEVEALGGEPGVKSARYADDGSFSDNIYKLLHNMEGKQNRNAQFRTIISLILQGREYKFEGVCKGIIIASKKGELGFGYDPVFMPQGSDKTFGEMNLEEKNLYSHRRKAVEKLIDFLQKHNQP